MKHISLDLWGTLIYSHPDYKNKRAELIAEFIAEYYELHLLTTSVFSSIKKEEKILDMIQEETHEQIPLNAALIWILYHNGVPISSIKKEHLNKLKSRLNQLFKQYPPTIIPGVVEMFEGLKERGITSNLLSNTCLIPGVILEEFIHSSGIRQYMSFTLYSDQHQFCKPSEGYFTLVMEEMFNHNIPVEWKNIIHIGDNPITDGIASEYGMGHILISPHADSPHPKISEVLKLIDNYVIS